MNTPMFLKIFFPSPSDDGILEQKYANAVIKHNEKAASSHPDAGFDLFCPINESVIPGSSIWIDMKVKAAAFIKDSEGNPTIPVSYYIYPRSSISKTPLRLSNSVGIIDSGYRGNLIAALFHYGKPDDKNYEINRNDRLVQICSPTLGPVFVEIVSSEDKLGFTERGAGGFGSSGK